MPNLTNLSNEDIMKEYTDSLLHDSKKAPSILKNSKYANNLLEQGKNVIPDIGKYILKNLVPPLNNLEEEERETLMHGWILLLCKINNREKIDTGSTILGYNLENWGRWASEYTPN